MKHEFLETLDLRALALRATREFFWGRGYREIDTPVLSPALIPEASIENFTATMFGHSGRPLDLYLVPSPEVWMKRLLALGSGNLFQLARCFRNREVPSAVHAPEFMMLEWYTVDQDYRDSLVLQEEYIDSLRRSLGTDARVTVRGRTIDLTPPFRRLSMREAFRDLAGADLDGLLKIEALADRAHAVGCEPTPTDTWESLFHKVFLQSVEPLLPQDRPLFLTDYPAALPTLARTQSDGSYAERWELFAAGIEIANCFTEERDPRRLERFFRGVESRKRSAFVTPRADAELEEIIARDLPPCTGNALGFDRLLMVLLGKDRIAQVLPFALTPDASETKS